MQQFMFFDKKIEISQSYIRLLLIIFAFAVLSKGAVIFRGFAVDDYGFSSGASQGTFDLLFSQGRYVGALVFWIFDALSINMTDMYFSLGIVTLLLYSVFIASILRFVGMENSPAAGLVGAIIVAHPYLTELFTFRVALPNLSIALVFSIIALEMLIKSPAAWCTRLLVLLATLAMLFTYQIFLNYFAVAIIFAFIFGQIFHNKANNVYRERAVTLTVISSISAIVFFITMQLANVMGLAKVLGRASTITFGEIPERIEQASSTLVNIYWSAEAVFSGGLKTIVALMLVVSIVIIFWHLLTEKNQESSIKKVLFVFFAFALLIPISLGVIIAFKSWWPVPRVIAHVAIITGLIFLLADLCIPDSGNRFLKSIMLVFKIIILVGFVLLSNQILADQQRINEWDKMMANRIISRLETLPNFGNVKFIYANGGSFFSYPALLRTPEGDMNISALTVPYSKAALLSEVSGYNFKGVWKGQGEVQGEAKATIGETYCASKQPWPHSESVTIDNDLAIICLKK